MLPPISPGASLTSSKLRLQVLIVDDCPEDIEAYRRYLRTSADYLYHVTTAATGKEALGLCHAQQWDLVLLDLNLPDMDGLEVLSDDNDIGGLKPTPVVQGAIC